MQVFHDVDTRIERLAEDGDIALEDWSAESRIIIHPSVVGGGSPLQEGCSESSAVAGAAAAVDHDSGVSFPSRTETCQAMRVLVGPSGTEPTSGGWRGRFVASLSCQHDG